MSGYADGGDGRCRVLRVVGELNFGGTEMRTAELLPRLATAGTEVHFVTLSDRIGPGPLAEAAVRHGGSVTPIPLDARFPLRFLRLLRRLRPDVVHVDCANFSGAVLCLALLGRVPTRVAHFRGDDNQHRNLRRRAQRWCWRQLLRASATDILGVSPSALTCGYQPAWRDDPRCQVVLNGLDLDRLHRPSGDHLRALTGRARTTCSASAWAGLAGEATLAPAADPGRSARPERGRPRRAGRPLGRGRRRSRPAAAAAHGVADRVHLLGPRDDVGGLLRQADVVVHPSCLEGLPGGVLEPVALGIGTVAADLPGVRFIHEHLPGVTIVDTEAAPAVWATAVRTAAAFTMATDPETAGERFQLSPFAIEAAVTTHLAIYRRRLPDGPPSAPVDKNRSRLPAASER
ncbi:glycosyltransferase [Micromonospora sp. M12]